MNSSKVYIAEKQSRKLHEEVGVKAALRRKKGLEERWMIIKRKNDKVLVSCPFQE